MSRSPALDLAEALVGEVLRLQQPADAVVAAFGRRHRQLGSRDRQRLGDLVFELLRRRLALEALAADGPGPLPRRLAILAWPEGEVAGLAREVDQAVLAWRSERLAGPAPDLGQPEGHNLPPWLADALRQALGHDEAEFQALAGSLLAPASLDLRCNVLKIKRDALRQALAREGVVSQATPFSPWGLRVQGKPSLSRLAAFEAGQFEVQDEGSQLLALLLDARRGETVVDFCAGAGGKTLAMAMAMRDKGRILALDTSGGRLEGLRPRLARSGLACVYPMHIAHERDERLRPWMGKADRVLVDAPCSGTGTLRRSPDLKWRLDAAKLAPLGQQQRAVLAAAAQLVRPGGRLVYATCSLLPQENEAVADEFEQVQGGAFVRLPAAQALAKATDAPTLQAGGHLRLWPHQHQTDGFFGAVWQRR